MKREAIFHQAAGTYAYPVSPDKLLIQLKAAKDDLKNVYLIYGDRYSGPDAVDQIMMERYASDLLFDYFRVEIQLSTKRFRYHFLLDDGQECLWYNELGFNEFRPTGYHAGYFQYPYITERDHFQTPAWLKDAIIYQIFPERFYNGDLTNDPPGCKEWGEMPKGQLSFFGGDLKGIIKKLGHLEELSVNLLYLTPIFSAPTNHKYDTIDYYKIDPHFGDKEVFRQLVIECHQRGIKVVLDAVFNHCGYEFAQFQDVVLKGQDSQYCDWFYINDFPVNNKTITFETFASNIWRLPKLRTANPEVKKYLLDIAEYWVREFDIDGWRLDVANEVDHAFWREFRDHMKKIKSDFYIIGEVWHYAGEFLRGDQFDGVMNYPFRDAVIRFFGERKMSVNEFVARLTVNRVNYKKQAVEAAWNLLDSHDTDRILTRFNGNRNALKLAIVFQMTYVGVPMIYYGTEIGLLGGDDPDCRRCMIWDEEAWDHELFAHYKKLIQIRKKQRALREGEFKTVYLSELGVYGFLRYLKNEQILVLLNNGISEQRIELDVCSLKFNPSIPLYDLIQNQNYKIVENKLIINLKPMQAAILTQN